MILISGCRGLIGSAVARHLYPARGYDLPQDIPPNVDYDVFIDCARYDSPHAQLVTWNHVADHFKRNGAGRIILFGSIYGHKCPDFSIYPGTEIEPTPLDYAFLKGGTEQATRYLAHWLKPWGIQVNAIAPGGVMNNHSDEFQSNYLNSGGVSMIEPKNLLPVVDMLLHPDNAVNGQVITVDGGWSL